MILAKIRDQAGTIQSDQDRFKECEVKLPAPIVAQSRGRYDPTPVLYTLEGIAQASGLDVADVSRCLSESQQASVDMGGATVTVVPRNVAYGLIKRHTRPSTELAREIGATNPSQRNSLTKWLRDNNLGEPTPGGPRLLTATEYETAKERRSGMSLVRSKYVSADEVATHAGIEPSTLRRMLSNARQNPFNGLFECLGLTFRKLKKTRGTGEAYMFEREILEMPGPILKKNLLEAQRLQRVGSDDSVVLSEFARDSPVLSKVDFSAVHAMAHRKLAQRRHTRGGKTKLVVSRNFAGQLETYYDSYTIPEMGEKLGIEETTLLKWMKEFGTKEIHGGIYSLCGLTFGQFLPDSWVRFPKGCIDTMDAKAKGEEITAYVAARRRGRGRGYPDIMGVIADVFPGEPDGNDMEMITAIRDGLLKIDRLEPKLSFMVAKAARDFTDRNLHHETAQDDPQGLPKPKSHKEEPQRLKIHLNNLFILAARIVDSGGESEDARKQQIQELLAKFNKETAGNIGVTP